ncbi:MCM2/3/5 family protein [compost metagenome]
MYIVQWPDDYPEKGDITDWYVKLGYSAEDFRKLLDKAERYIDPRFAQTLAEDGEAQEVALAESADAKLHGKRIQVPVMVSGKDDTPFIVPKKIVASCGDAANGDNPKCQICNMCSHGGEMTKEFNSRDNTLMKLVRSSEENVMKQVALSLGINVKCNVYNINVEEYMNIEEIRMIPKADTGFGFAAVNDYVVRNGMCMGRSLKPNKRYTMLGYMYPDPASQQASYLFDKAIPEKDLLSEFEVTEDTIEELKKFQVAKGQTIEEKFNEIHTDLERNVTYVWERRDVGIAVDLIYHTALHFYFQNQFIKRGWGELLIIGDSGQAKTTLVERIMAHYKAGELHSGESSKRTGLVYSIQQTSKRWFLVWGAFPLNDGGLICLDELSGLPEDDLAVMSDVRSSGIAKTTGVITSETTARTRAIYISNPRNGRQLNTETFGVNAVLKLFGKTEDVRRLDMAMAVASGDIDPSIVNRPVDEMPTIPHKYTSDICNTRVLWAWSRRPDQIKFDKDAETAILYHATDMGKRYSSKIPIVEAADQRIKIARLAISCAACVFSTDDEAKNVIVKKEHVDFVVKFMDRIYSTRSLGYDKMSEIELEQSDASSASITNLVKKFMAVPAQDFNELVDSLYQLPYFNKSTLEDYTGMDRDDLRILLKFLTTNHLVEKYRSDYRRLPLGTQFLEFMRANKVTPEQVAAARKQLYSGNDY